MFHFTSIQINFRSLQIEPNSDFIITLFPIDSLLNGIPYGAKSIGKFVIRIQIWFNLTGIRNRFLQQVKKITQLSV